MRTNKFDPSAADAEWYTACGLVFCTDATLNQMLGIIEFAAHGLHYPLRLDARRSGNIITVNPDPDPEDAGLTPDQVTTANRAKYILVAANSTDAQTTTHSDNRKENI